MSRDPTRGAIGSDTDRILLLPYPYLYPTIGYRYWGMRKNKIRIRQNRISDMNRILADADADANRICKKWIQLQIN